MTRPGEGCDLRSMGIGDAEEGALDCLAPDGTGLRRADVLEDQGSDLAALGVTSDDALTRARCHLLRSGAIEMSLRS
jgi:hypothetical protein